MAAATKLNDHPTNLRNHMRRTINFLETTVTETPWDEQIRDFFGGPVPFEARTCVGLDDAERLVGLDVKRLYDDTLEKVIAAGFQPDSVEETGAALVPRCFLLRWSDTSLISFDGVRVLALSRDAQEAQGILKHLNKKYHVSWPTKKPEDPPLVKLMTSHDGRLIDASLELTGPCCQTEETIGLLYGDDMIQWHRGLVKIMESKLGGLVVLRGDPGTGKTSYLRTLVHCHRETIQFHYLPVSDSWLLDDDSLARYLRNKRERNSGKAMVILIEDAEELLRPRDTNDRRSNISPLLNATDGILRDEMAVTIICTANCPLKAMDSAVSRPGRLMAFREFTALDTKQARLVAAHYNLAIPDCESITLAELFNSQLGMLTSEPERVVGFRSLVG